MKCNLCGRPEAQSPFRSLPSRCRQCHLDYMCALRHGRRAAQFGTAGALPPTIDRTAAAVAQDNVDALTEERAMFVKHDSGKPAAELLPPRALLEVAKVLGFGAKKYAPHGWRKVDKRSRYAGACMRHLLAWLDGEDKDQESGLPHLAHLACNALFLLEAELLGLGEDDRSGKTPQK